MNMLKVKRLSNGSVVMAGSIRQAFGPGRAKDTRITDLRHQAHPHDAAFFVSRDGCHTWDGPHYVFPGILAWEFDFVELPEGDLLFINSQIQSGPSARQIVRRTTAAREYACRTRPDPSRMRRRLLMITGNAIIRANTFLSDEIPQRLRVFIFMGSRV